MDESELLVILLDKKIVQCLRKRKRELGKAHIPVLRRQRWEDCWKFEANLVYIGSTRPARNHGRQVPI